jgi:hypothetical protein
MDTIAIIAALEQVAATSLNLPGFQFGHALAAAQQVYAEHSAQPITSKPVETLATV